MSEEGELGVRAKTWRVMGLVVPIGAPLEELIWLTKRLLIKRPRAFYRRFMLQLWIGRPSDIETTTTIHKSISHEAIP